MISASPKAVTAFSLACWALLLPGTVSVYVNNDSLPFGMGKVQVLPMLHPRHLGT